MEWKFQITVLENGTRAVVRHLSVDDTEERIKAALAAEGIVYGIRWDEIGKAVAEVGKTGAPLENVVVAHIPVPEPEIYLGNLQIKNIDEFRDFKENLSRIYRVIKEGDASMKYSGGIFIKDGEQFLTIKNIEMKNVFGKNVLIQDQRYSFKQLHGIKQKASLDGYEYIAETAGWLSLNSNDELTILNPFEVTPDKLEMYGIVLPAVHGKDALFDKLSRFISGLGGLKDCITIPELKQFVDGHKFARVLIRRGIAPVKGVEGRIVYKIEKEIKPLENSDGNVDFKETNQYIEITKGTVIVEETPTIMSKNGIDVYGEVIPVDQVIELKIDAGKNVRKEERDGKYLYIAEETGILVLKTNYIGLEPELVIHEDVCMQTGNIKYSRNIIVNGNVCSGFKIFCGGDLTIQKGVEDCSEIHCGGNLNIAKGLFGDQTKVVVNGNAKIGFIQNAYIRVKGDLLIREYAYQSQIYCGGKLVIEGYGININERGCLIGGTVCGLHSIEALAAGSSSSLTTLYCGIDPELEEKFNEMTATQSVLKKRIAATQNKIGCDLLDKRSMEMLKNLPEKRRQEIKIQLKNLRELMETNAKLETAIAELNDRVYAKNLNELSIVIKRNLIPQLLIVFKNMRRRISESYFNISMKIDKGVISFNSSSAKN